MISSWRQALSLVILIFNVPRIVAINWGSLGSDIENGADGVVSSIEGEASQLIGDLESDFQAFEKALESELSKALVDSNGTLAQFTMGYQTTPPISTRLVTSGIQSNVTVGLYCDSCSGSSQPEAFDFASQNYSGWDNSWLGFALDNFDAFFEIDIELTAVANGEITLSLLKIVAAAEGVVVEVDFQLYLVADASASMSFTTGLNLTLTDPAAIMMPALDSLDPVVRLNESQRIGFSQDNFVLAPIFNASVPKLDFSVQFSLRTVFSVTVEDINIGALYLDLPAFNLTVNTLTNAMSNCQTPPAGTPSDQIYAELIHLDGALVAELSYELLDGHKTGVIETWTIWDALDKCYAFFPGLGSIGDVPSSSKSPLLTAAAITTCTTGGTGSTTGTAAVGAALKSLSPGAKAGAVIGTLTGAALIAALAWYGGRASLNRSIKNGGTDSAWTIPRPRSGKFFTRRKGGGTTEFSPVTPNTPAWQNTGYEGGYFPTPNPQMQQQFAHQTEGGYFQSPNPQIQQQFVHQPEGGYFQSSNSEAQRQFTRQDWQMAQKEPFVITHEAITPASTYISMDDHYGTPTPRAEERVPTRNNNGSQPTIYEGTRSEQADGLGLLQGGGRPVVKRKEVSRKSVPGYGNASGSF